MPASSRAFTAKPKHDRYHRRATVMLLLDPVVFTNESDCLQVAPRLSIRLFFFPPPESVHSYEGYCNQTTVAYIHSPWGKPECRTYLDTLQLQVHINGELQLLACCKNPSQEPTYLHSGNIRPAIRPKGSP